MLSPRPRQDDSRMQPAANLVDPPDQLIRPDDGFLLAFTDVSLLLPDYQDRLATGTSSAYLPHGICKTISYSLKRRAFVCAFRPTYGVRYGPLPRGARPAIALGILARTSSRSQACQHCLQGKAY
eukprot:606886-Hanusia_phi.AAC.1